MSKMLSVAVTKLNEMIKSPKFVKIISVDDRFVIIQNETGYQQIDFWGKVYNADSLEKFME